MLDYKVGHYIKYEDISQSNKKNILPSFMFSFLKKTNRNTDKLKARQVADGSQQGRYLYEFISSTTLSLQVLWWERVEL